MTKFGLRSTEKLVTGTLFHSIISDFKLPTQNWLVKMLLQVFAEATLQAVSQSVAKSSKMILFNAEASCSWGDVGSWKHRWLLLQCMLQYLQDFKRVETFADSMNKIHGTVIGNKNIGDVYYQTSRGR